jgi:hypothetical protein
MAVEAQMELRRHRSIPLPSGIKPASDTLTIPIHALRNAGEPAAGSPMKNGWPDPIQPHGLPRIMRTRAGSPAEPSHDHPQIK